MKSNSYLLYLCTGAFALCSLISAGCSKNNEQAKTHTDASTLTASAPVLNLKCTGYIKSVIQKGDDTEVLIDTVEWFSGEEAAQKARAEDMKKLNKRSTDLPEPFYIRNTKIDSLRTSLSPGCIITMQTYSHDSTGNFRFNEPLKKETFLNIFRGKGHEALKNAPYSFDIKNSRVSSIKEIYIP